MYYIVLGLVGCCWWLGGLVWLYLCLVGGFCFWVLVVRVCVVRMCVSFCGWFCGYYVVGLRWLVGLVCCLLFEVGLVVCLVWLWYLID